MRLVFDSRRAAIRLAKGLRREKPEMSFQAIADVLNARGHRNTIGQAAGERGAQREFLPLETEKAIVDGARAGYSHSHLAKFHGVSRRAVSLAVRRYTAKLPGGA